MENRLEGQQTYVPGIISPEYWNSGKNSSEDWAVAVAYLLVDYLGQNQTRNDEVEKIILEMLGEP